MARWFRAVALLAVALSVTGCSGTKLGDKAACAQGSASLARAIRATVAPAGESRKAFLAESDAMRRLANRTASPGVRAAIRHEAAALRGAAHEGLEGRRAADAMENAWKVAAFQPCHGTI